MNKKSFLFFVIFLAISVFSCTPDDPEMDVREKIAIKWDCEDNDGEFTRHYEVTIQKDLEANKIYLSNFHNLGSAKKIYATISGSYISIPMQTIDIYKVSGSGTVGVDGQKIEWQYKLNDGIADIIMTAKFTPSQIAKKSIQ